MILRVRQKGVFVRGKEWKFLWHLGALFLISAINELSKSIKWSANLVG